MTQSLPDFKMITERIVETISTWFLDIYTIQSETLQMFKMQIADHERKDEWIAFSKSRWIENQVLQYSIVGIVELGTLTISLGLEHCCLKVSKYKRQNTKFSHPPKNQRIFVHFFALASKKWLKQKLRRLMISSSNQGLFNTVKSF